MALPIEAVHRAGEECVPRWDAVVRELRVEDRVVKCYRQRADMQELILAAFQEEQWPARIFDPLPSSPAVDRNARLRDVVRRLNRQRPQVIQFYPGAQCRDGSVLCGLSRRRNGGLGFCSPIGIPIVSRPLQDLLEPHFSKRFELGRLRVGDRIIEGRVTFRDPAPVRVRGGKQSYCFRCLECRQVIYQPMGNWYLLSGDVPDEMLSAVEGHGGLIADVTLAAAVRAQRFRHVAVKPITVRDQPADGFPANLETIQPHQERRFRSAAQV